MILKVILKGLCNLESSLEVFMQFFVLWVVNVLLHDTVYLTLSSMELPEFHASQDFGRIVVYQLIENLNTFLKLAEVHALNLWVPLGANG